MQKSWEKIYSIVRMEQAPANFHLFFLGRDTYIGKNNGGYIKQLYSQAPPSSRNSFFLINNIILEKPGPFVYPKFRP